MIQFSLKERKETIPWYQRKNSEKRYVLCPDCDIMILPGDQECPHCGFPVRYMVEGKDVKCRRCGHFPVFVLENGSGDCPKCGKPHT